MAYQRSFSNSVVLPNGDVLVVGGQQHPQTFTDTGAVLSPELWNPSTGKFTIMAPEAIPRTYHSVAILLPDGRVFSGGGGLCGDGCTANHPDGQIFSPPYLFNANGSLRRRPVIRTAPAKATTGSTITVTTNSAHAQLRAHPDVRCHPQPSTTTSAASRSARSGDTATLTGCGSLPALACCSPATTCCSPSIPEVPPAWPRSSASGSPQARSSSAERRSG